MRRSRLTLLSLTLAMAVLGSLPMSAAAFSNTNSYNVTSNLKLTANVWIGSGCINGFGVAPHPGHDRCWMSAAAAVVS